MRVRVKWAIIVGAALFGLLLTVFFGAFFGGVGGRGVWWRVLNGVYGVLIFPVPLFGTLIVAVTGRAIGNIRGGLAALVFLSMPLTYGLLGWGVASLIEWRQKRRARRQERLGRRKS